MILDFNTAKRQGETAKAGFDVDDVRDRLQANPRAFGLAGAENARGRK